MYEMATLPALITDARPYLPVLREGKPVYVDGKPVKRNPSHLLVCALVVPVSGQELMLQPEGDRLKEQYWLFQDPTQTRLDGKAVNMRLATEDKLWLLDATYVVQNARFWGSYVQALATRVDVGLDQSAFPTIPKELQ